MKAMSVATGELRDPIEELLRKKIGWICHSVRCMGALYIAWALFGTLQFWSNEATVTRRFTTLTGVRIDGISGLDRLACVALDLLGWCMMLGMVVNLWRLFGGYLKGSVFTVIAARLYTRIGLFAGAALLYEVIEVPLFAQVLSAHLAVSVHVPWRYLVGPAWLMELTFCAIVIALGHVFKTAAEIARDREGFV
jgi:signal transduction histidine kinase